MDVYEEKVVEYLNCYFCKDVSNIVFDHLQEILTIKCESEVDGIYYKIVNVTFLVVKSIDYGKYSLLSERKLLLKVIGNQVENHGFRIEGEDGETCYFKIGLMQVAYVASKNGVLKSFVPLFTRNYLSNFHFEKSHFYDDDYLCFFGGRCSNFYRFSFSFCSRFFPCDEEGRNLLEDFESGHDFGHDVSVLELL
jgi:hypothetical protein